jgi:ABC-type transporter Mla subunit MlaD
MSASRTRKSDLRVGLFVALGVAVFVAAIFLIGQERHFFERPVYLATQFNNVSGLKIGAQVLLSGVDVGIVSKIEFPVLDSESDARVLGSTDVGVLSNGAVLALKESPIALSSPTTLSFTVEAAKPRFSARLKVVGRDRLDKAIEETVAIKVRVNTALGKRIYSKVDRIELLAISGHSPGDSLRVGDGAGRKVTVRLRVPTEVLPRIRHDSRARVESMGLLGDKIVVISLGSSGAAQIVDGDMLEAEPGLDLNEIADEVRDVFDGFTAEAGEMPELIAKAVNQIGDGALVGAIRRVETLLAQVEDGPGVAHELLYAEKPGRDTEQLLASLKTASSRLDQILADAETMVRDVKTGNGLAHALLYSDDGENTVAAARKTLEEAQTILSDVRTKEGILHQLIYVPDNGKAISNLTQASEDLKIAVGDAKQATADVKSMVADVNSGKGTLGALVRDPTVYEDLKILLGNVKRNDALKALIRYTVEREDQIAAPK